MWADLEHTAGNLAKGVKHLLRIVDHGKIHEVLPKPKGCELTGV